MRSILGLGLALWATAGGAQDVAEAVAVRYDCDGGASVSVAYVNPPGGDSYAVVLWDGALLPMKAGPTGSGVRYVSTGADGLIWHTKGAEGFLARDDAGETMIAAGCVERD